MRQWPFSLVKRHAVPRDVCVSAKLCFARMFSGNFFLKLYRAQNVEPLRNFKKGTQGNEIELSD